MNTDNVFFYCVPEGRSLVEGVPTKIYFRTNDSYGNAFPFLGQISDGSGKVISEVSGDDNGKGEFMYTPRANDKLSLLIARPFNGQLKVNLPKVQTQHSQTAVPASSPDRYIPCPLHWPFSF